MAKKSKSVVNTKDYDYGSIRVRDKDGKLRNSVSNGDAVAKAMLLFTAGGGDIARVIRDNKLEMKTKGRNAGLLRMSVGVALRGLINNGTPVKVGSLTVKTLKQPIVMPKVEAAAPGRKKAAKKVAKRAAPRKRAAAPVEAAASAAAE